MFKNFETQADIANRTSYTLGTVRKFARDARFPKAEHVIGRTHFYSKRAVDRYFDSKVDHRFKEYRR